MRLDRLLEFLLARFTTRVRACAILGDLMEERSTMGAAWFWQSYAWVFICLAWRTPVAWLAAFVSAAMYQAFFHTVTRVWHALTQMGIGPEAHRFWPQLFFRVAFFVGLAMLGAVPSLVLRFGIRDRVTQLALVLGLVSTVGLYFRPLTLVAAVSALLTMAIAMAAASSPSWRGPLAVLVVARLIASLAATALSLLLKSLPFSFTRFTLRPQHLWILDGFFVLLFGVTCSLLRKWLPIDNAENADDNDAIALRT